MLKANSKKLVRTRFARITSRPTITKHHVRRYDTVKVLSGKFKGVISPILKIVDNNFVYLAKVYKLKSMLDRKGTRSEYRIYNKVHISNVMNYDVVNNVASRIKHVVHDGKKVRMYVKTKTLVPDVCLTKQQRIAVKQQREQGYTKDSGADNKES